MAEVSKSSFEDIKTKTDSFRKYLKNLNVETQPNSPINIILNSINTVIELYHSGEIPNGEINELKDAANGWVISDLFLQIQGTKLESLFISKWPLLSSGNPRLLQRSGSSNERDLLHEVYCAATFANFCDSIEFDEPDLTLIFLNYKWGIACKNPTGSTSSIRKAIRKGINQIENARVDFGIVAIDLTNIINHSEILIDRRNTGEYTYKSFRSKEIAIKSLSRVFLEKVKEIEGSVKRSLKEFPKIIVKSKAILYMIHSLCIVQKTLCTAGLCKQQNLSPIIIEPADRLCKSFNNYWQDFSGQSKKNVHIF